VNRVHDFIQLENTKQHLKEATSERDSLHKQTKSVSVGEHKYTFKHPITLNTRPSIFPPSSSNQMLKKAEKQKHKLKEADKTIKELLEAKKERDALLTEKTQLVEAKQKYFTRTSELTERVQILMVRS
jgi:predicted ribosome quality control (RQC) complex YloA/Tae2 family protein